MIKITAFKNGIAIKIATVEDHKEIKTVTINEAIHDAKWTFAENGIEYDTLEAKFTEVNADINELNQLFYSLNCPELMAMENDFINKR